MAGVFLPGRGWREFLLFSITISLGNNDIHMLVCTHYIDFFAPAVLAEIQWQTRVGELILEDLTPSTSPNMVGTDALPPSDSKHGSFNYLRRHSERQGFLRRSLLADSPPDMLLRRLLCQKRTMMLPHTI